MVGVEQLSRWSEYCPGGQEVVHGKLRRCYDAETFCEMEVVYIVLLSAGLTESFSAYLPGPVS